MFMHTYDLTAGERIGLILGALCRAVAARISPRSVGPGDVPVALPAALIVLIWGRVRRIEHQIQGLLARFRAGLLRTRVVVTPRCAGLERVAEGDGSRQMRLPVGFAWLVPLVPVWAAGCGSQTRHWLADPEVRALLAVSAQARRVLKPLCRMLGIEPEALDATTPKDQPATRRNEFSSIAQRSDAKASPSPNPHKRE
jgi:hypothetical protein